MTEVKVFKTHAAMILNLHKMAAFGNMLASHYFPKTNLWCLFFFCLPLLIYQLLPLLLHKISQAYSSISYCIHCHQLFFFSFDMEQAGDLPLVIRSSTLVLVTLLQRFLQYLLCRRQGFPKNVRSCKDLINPVECLECLKYPEFCSSPCNELDDSNFLFTWVVQCVW